MNMIRRTIGAVTLAVLALLAARPVIAATTVNSTTTSGAVTTNRQQVIKLASVTSISLNDVAFMDREAMQVNAIDTTALTITVTRGVRGTSALPHASGVVVWTGPPRAFYMNQVVGSCSATTEEYLPHIVLPGPGSDQGGDVYDCKSSEWIQIREGGYRTTALGRSDGGTTYTVLGALTVQPGISFINGTTLAMTLANPTTEQNGMVMIIMATNASAHTVTYTAGFNGGTTARDVATFGGAVDDNMMIIAYNGVWWVISSRNVTFG